MTRICRHCRRSTVNRPRGLCCGCFYTPGIKELYPSTSKYAYRGIGLGNQNPPLPPTPTAALPAEPEKVAEMARRAEAGYAIFHPNDARRADDG